VQEGGGKCRRWEQCRFVDTQMAEMQMCKMSDRVSPEKQLSVVEDANRHWDQIEDSSQ
jgi:hypothetical protein